MRCDLVSYEGIGHPAIDPAFWDLVPDIERRTVEFIAEVVLEPLGYMDEPPVVPPTTRPTTPPGPVAPTPAPARPAPSSVQPAPGRGQALPAVAVLADPDYTG